MVTKIKTRTVDEAGLCSTVTVHWPAGLPYGGWWGEVGVGKTVPPPLLQWSSSKGICSPGDTWQCLETSVAFITGRGVAGYSGCLPSPQLTGDCCSFLLSLAGPSQASMALASGHICGGH